jgi:hypothetical protein
MRLQGGFVHQAANGKVGHEQPIKLLPDQFRSLAAQDDLGPSQVLLQLVQRRPDFPSLAIERRQFLGGGRAGDRGSWSSCDRSAPLPAHPADDIRSRGPQSGCADSGDPRWSDKYEQGRSDPPSAGPPPTLHSGGCATAVRYPCTPLSARVRSWGKSGRPSTACLFSERVPRLAPA